MICGRALQGGVRVGLGVVILVGAVARGQGGVVDLPSSKQIVGAVPGNPQRVNSEPV
jgi:hypothetical protein